MDVQPIFMDAFYVFTYQRKIYFYIFTSQKILYYAKKGGTGSEKLPNNTVNNIFKEK